MNHLKALCISEFHQNRTLQNHFGIGMLNFQWHKTQKEKRTSKKQPSLLSDKKTTVSESALELSEQYFSKLQLFYCDESETKLESRLKR